MPVFLIEIDGNAHRAMGLLAKSGIQNLVSPSEPTKRLSARLSADSLKSARDRVLAALAGEAFTIEGVEPEERSGGSATPGRYDPERS